MTNRPKSFLILLVCAVAMFAVACGGGSTSAQPSEGATSSPDVPAVEQTAAQPASSGSSESPIADLLGLPLGDDEAMDEYFTELSRQAEVKIAECMLAQGFRYHVVDYSQLGGGVTVATDFESREFAEGYGFGIASNPFEESFEAFEEFEDPNREYVESLTDGERDAYQIALSGELPDLDNATSSFFEPGGCQGEAFDEMFSFAEVFEQFGDQFAEIEEAIEADPRIVDARSGWSACMTQAGHRFTDVKSAESEIRRRYNEIIGDEAAFSGTGVVVGGGAASSDEDGTIVFGPQTLDPEAQKQVDELAVEERAIAVASWDCNAPLREIEDDIRLEYEQRFVDENGAAIRSALAE